MYLSEEETQALRDVYDRVFQLHSDIDKVICQIKSDSPCSAQQCKLFDMHLERVMDLLCHKSHDLAWLRGLKFGPEVKGRPTLSTLLANTGQVKVVLENALGIPKSGTGCLIPLIVLASLAGGTLASVVLFVL